MKGHVASEVDSLMPVMYIHLGVVDWKLLVHSGLQEGHVPSH